MPIGTFNESSARMLQLWKHKFCWLQWDGTMAHCTAKDAHLLDCPFMALTAEHVKQDAKTKMISMVCKFHNVSQEDLSAVKKESLIVEASAPPVKADDTLACLSGVTSELQTNQPSSGKECLSTGITVDGNNQSLVLLLPGEKFSTLINSRLLPALRTMAATLEDLTGTMWRKARAERRVSIGITATKYGKLATPMLLQELPSEFDENTSDAWQRWFQNVRNWLDEIEACDIDVQDCLLNQ